MDFALILPPGQPRGEALIESLREAILSGRLCTGDRLPPTRTLAAQLGFSRGTVVAAYEELTGEGYCTARTGAGTFVAIHARGERRAPSGPVQLSAWGSRLAPPVGQPEDASPRWNFRAGAASGIFPSAAFSRALRRATARLAQLAGAGDPAGSPRLRAALAVYLAHARAVRASADDIVVVSGSQQGLDLVARLLVDPGETVVVEEPGYPRARAVFAALGARIVPVPIDSEGLRVDLLPSGGARLIYVTPSHQYPTGAVLAPERRLALLEWVARHDGWLLEDDYDSEFRYSGAPLPSVQGLDRAGRCLYLGSLSKLLHPALRVGYLVAPPALTAAAIAAKSTLDQATSPTVQEALADLFVAGEIERHLRWAGREYRARRAELIAACARHLPSGVRLWPVTGGLHAFLEAPNVDAAALQREAAARGVAYTDAAGSYHTPPSGTAAILWFSRIPRHEIEPGIAALGAALRAAEGPHQPLNSRRMRAISAVTSALPLLAVGAAESGFSRS